MDKIKPLLILNLFLFFSSNTAFANTEEEDELAKLQKQLNAQVMEKPFSVEDEAKIDSYIKNAMKKDLKPEKKVPTFWKPGYTCADIYRYGWNYYRNCRYYRHYYGRYW